MATGGHCELVSFPHKTVVTVKPVHLTTMKDHVSERINVICMLTEQQF